MGRGRFFIIATILAVSCLCLGQSTDNSDQMVAVNGRQVHVVLAGRGAPTVIFEAGFVNNLGSWSKVQPQIATSRTTLSYDRAGIGRSEESPSPRTGEQITQDLHALLVRLGLRPPYVLVGHSAGGLYIRSFARRYPKEIVGMVFVDAVLPEYLRWLRANDAKNWAELEKIGTQSGDVVRAQWLGLEPTLEELEQASLPQLPVAVLVSNQPDLPFKPPNAMEAFLQTQRAFAGRVKGAQMKIINAGHELPTLAPETVSRAIDEVVKRARSKTP